MSVKHFIRNLQEMFLKDNLTVDQIYNTEENRFVLTWRPTKHSLVRMKRKLKDLKLKNRD